MATKAREAAHGPERRFQPLDRLNGPDPPEVAGAHHRQQIEAEIGRRAPAQDLPGNCPAATCDRPPLRRSRKTATYGALSGARQGHRLSVQTIDSSPEETGSPSAR